MEVTAETVKAAYAGVKVADLGKALEGGMDLARQRPGLKKSKLLIESMRHEKQSKLTAADHKLYQMLLTKARSQGGDRREYDAEIGEMASFLGETHLDRIRASLDRLARTSVTYDFVDGKQVRRWGTLKLLGYEGVDDLRAGTSKLTYWFDPPVQRELLEPRSFTVLDLYEVSCLTCRYAPRLHELLALPAGYDAGFRKPVRFAPEDLAAMLGYVPSRFNYAIFRRDVLGPAMADIANNVTSFKARLTEERAGRGRGGGKVIGVVFDLTSTAKTTAGMQAARLGSEVYGAAKAARERGDADMPSSIAIGRVVTAHGEPDNVLWNKWQEAVRLSRADPNVDLGGLQGGMVLREIALRGADTAFITWADAMFRKRQLAPSAGTAESQTPEPVKETETLQQPVPEAAKAVVPDDRGPVPREEDFENYDDFYKAACEWLGQKAPPEDIRSPREKSIDKVRQMAIDIVDLLDGYKPQTGRTELMDGPDLGQHVDTGWIRNMTWTSYGWEEMGKDCMPGEVRMAWRPIEEALGIMRRLPYLHQDVRRTGVYSLAKAMAVWDLDGATAAANRIIASAPKTITSDVKSPPPRPTPGMAYREITELDLERGYDDPVYGLYDDEGYIFDPDSSDD